MSVKWTTKYLIEIDEDIPPDLQQKIVQGFVEQCKRELGWLIEENKVVFDNNTQKTWVNLQRTQVFKPERNEVKHEKSS